MSDYQALVAAREAQRTACEDCGLGTGTCDPVLMDNRKHLFCEPCCEDRRKRWDWRVPKPRPFDLQTALKAHIKSHVKAQETLEAEKENTFFGDAYKYSIPVHMYQPPIAGLSYWIDDKDAP